MERVQSEPLKAAVEQVSEWRARRGGRGSRVPEEIWKLAVAIARVEGVWATARALRVSYQRLKARMSRSTRADDRAVAREEKPAFVDLGMPALGGGGKAVVELSSPRGDRMRIELPGMALDLVGLAQTFWGRRS